MHEEFLTALVYVIAFKASKNNPRESFFFFFSQSELAPVSLPTVVFVPPGAQRKSVISHKLFLIWRSVWRRRLSEPAS